MSFTDTTISFGKKLKDNELADYQSTIKDAYKVLGKDSVDLIIHDPSLPSLPEEDTGISSLNTKGGRQFVKFINSIFGVNGIQRGPEGKTNKGNPSPYEGTIFSNNPLFIDLFTLTEEKWGSILNKLDLKKIVENNPNKVVNRVAYDYIYQEQEKALRKAFLNFREKTNNLSSLNPEESNTIKAINEKFTSFKNDEKNKYWLDKDAMFEALAKAYGNEYWPHWQSDLDKSLFIPDSKFSEKQINDRINQIEEDFKDEIEFYKFCQFIANEQKAETSKYFGEEIKTIADFQVAVSLRDYWAHKSAFKQGWFMGCPPDYFSEDGQSWNFPVIDSEKIFAKKGVLGEAGQFIKARCDKAFAENPGGVRIDHFIGWKKPWIYPENEKANSEKGQRLEVPTEVVTEILLNSAKTNNISKDQIICEDLGAFVPEVDELMKKEKLTGIKVSQFVDIDPEVENSLENHIFRGKNVDVNQCYVIGTHDNQSLASWVDELFENNNVEIHADYLAEDLGLDSSKIKNNQSELFKAKFVELFASPAKRVQIFWTDIFGLKDRYNNPGKADNNWTLRVPNDYENLYYNQLENNEGLNLPEILEKAINSKGKEVIEKNQKLLENLKRYSEELRKPV